MGMDIFLLLTGRHSASVKIFALFLSYSLRGEVTGFTPVLFAESRLLVV
jgi:hypothetical protein